MKPEEWMAAMPSEMLTEPEWMPTDEQADGVHKYYRALFISDVHLGSKGCQAEALAEFLKFHHAPVIYLVGDIIDGWRLKKRHFWPQVIPMLFVACLPKPNGVAALCMSRAITMIFYGVIRVFILAISNSATKLCMKP